MSNRIEIDVQADGSAIVTVTATGQKASFSPLMIAAILKRRGTQRADVAISWVGMAHMPARHIHRIQANRKGVVAA